MRFAPLLRKFRPKRRASNGTQKAQTGIQGSAKNLLALIQLAGTASREIHQGGQQDFKTGVFADKVIVTMLFYKTS